jgi:hypothetical protein
MSANGITRIFRRTAIRPLPWVRDDGGRAAAGYRGSAGDCVTRAVAIATGQSYQEAYDGISAAAREYSLGGLRVSGSARGGVPRPVYDAYLKDLGWTWTPVMLIGQGCTVHLRAGELPGGALITRLSRHLCAVIDGTVHDTHDPCRGGQRCVYGYFRPPDNENRRS